MTAQWPPHNVFQAETIADALTEAATRLRQAGSGSPRLDAEVLLRFVLGLDRTSLLLRLREPLPPDAASRFAALVERRLAGEPVAYLSGEREFMGLSFAVAPGVLVPRPETELMVEWALDWLIERTDSTVVDVGTGNGAIALSLAAHLPAAWHGQVIASDISGAALQIAGRNRRQLALEGRVALVQGDLLAWCARADLILANLPYLRPEQIAENSDLAAEPVSALLGGSDGLDLIRRLVADLPRVLTPAGGVALEIDPSQAHAVVSILAGALPEAAIQVHDDLAGLARLVTARRRR